MAAVLIVCIIFLPLIMVGVVASWRARRLLASGSVSTWRYGVNALVVGLLLPVVLLIGIVAFNFQEIRDFFADLGNVSVMHGHIMRPEGKDRQVPCQSLAYAAAPPLLQNWGNSS